MSKRKESPETEGMARKLRALMALAEQGTPGEQENAKTLLEKISRKYGVDINRVKDEEKQPFRWPRKDELHARLLHQIIAMVTGDRQIYTSRSEKTGRLNGDTVAYCTLAEKIEIDANFRFYAEAMKRDMDVFFLAFVQKNSLFPRTPSGTKWADLTREEKEKYFRAMAMQEGMDRHTLRKAITEG